MQGKNNVNLNYLKYLKHWESRKLSLLFEFNISFELTLFLNPFKYLLLFAVPSSHLFQPLLLSSLHTTLIVPPLPNSIHLSPYSSHICCPASTLYCYFMSCLSPSLLLLPSPIFSMCSYYTNYDHFRSYFYLSSSLTLLSSFFPRANSQPLRLLSSFFPFTSILLLFLSHFICVYLSLMHYKHSHLL